MRTSRFRFVVVALALLAVALVVFRDFVFGQKLLLYKDIGDDSLNFHYPYFVLLSEYLRSNGFPRWSFRVGMGQSIFPYSNSLLFDPVVWLTRDLIARALVYQHLLKVVICGLLFFRFLELKGIRFVAALLGALLLSLSAYLTMGSCWTLIGNEVVCLTFVLFAVETALVRGRWFYLPLAIASCGILTPVHFYLTALLLVTYVPARLFMQDRPAFASSVQVSFKLAGIALIGVGIAAVFWLNTMSIIRDSPRGSGLATYATKLRAFPVLGFESAAHYGSAILRQFSNDMVGSGSHFRGWQNYLEAPSSYCGLICLLLVPQIFVAASARRRLIYALFLLAISVLTIFPWFRYLFWLFQGDYYRTLSLFIVFGMISLSVMALSRYIEQRTLNLWLLAVTWFVLVIILYLPITDLQSLVSSGLRQVSTCLLWVYAVVLAAGKWLRRELLASWLLLLICALELCYFDHITVADRPIVTKSELKERVGYNDETVDAIRDIKAVEKVFFRLTKLYSSSLAQYGSLNDAVVFGYYGTTSYNSFNNVNYIRFLMAVDALPSIATELDTRWSRGLVGMRELLSFACEKYVLTPDPFPYQIDPRFEFVRQYGKKHLFRNKDSLPFGLFFTQYLTASDFMRLTTTQKEAAVRGAVVLERSEAAAAAGMPQSSPLSDFDEAKRSDFRLRLFNENRIAGDVQCNKPGILVFQMPFDRGWRAFVDQAQTPTLKADVGLLGIKLTEGRHHVKLRYLPPFFPIGLAVTGLSLVIFLVCLWRWPRITPALT